MAQTTKRAGVIGIGAMGKNVAELLHRDGYSLVLYNREPKAYEAFNGQNNIQTSTSLKDFAQKMSAADGRSVVWMMVPGGAVSNGIVSELSGLMRKNDIIIDAANAFYTDSIANYNSLKTKGIDYLDVGCAGGPDDLLSGVSLMVGGDREAFKAAEGIFKTVSGKGTYGYVGGSGAGQMLKIVHNGLFYAMFPLWSEATELLLKMQKENPSLDLNEGFKLLQACPPITTGIPQAISQTVILKKEKVDEEPQIKISAQVTWLMQRAEQLGVPFGITKAVVNGCAGMSNMSRKIYTAAKRKLTGH